MSEQRGEDRDYEEQRDKRQLLLTWRTCDWCV